MKLKGKYICDLYSHLYWVVGSHLSGRDLLMHNLSFNNYCLCRLKIESLIIQHALSSNAIVVIQSKATKKKVSV